MKKKTVSIMLTAAIVLSLAACGGGNQSSETTAAATTAAAETTTAGTTAAETTASAETTAAETTAAETTAAAGAGEELPRFDGQQLRISTFSFNAELLQKNVYDPFMEATGAELVVEGGANAERVTKIRETPDAYDIVVIGDAFVSELIKDGLIASIDSSKLTNLDGLYDIAKAPLGQDYGPAYTFNRIGIVYDSSTCPVEITSWADLWNADLADSIAIPDITTTSGPLLYYSIAQMEGLEPGTDDDAIFAKFDELKPNIAKTYTSANDAITMLNQGEVSVAVLLDYSYTTAKNASENYVWVDPSEGVFSGFNTINVLKDCPNMDLAETFVNYYISYDVQLAEALDGVDSPVRTDVELTEEQSANFTYGADMINSLQIPDWDVINANKADWIDRWNELFSVQ